MSQPYLSINGTRANAASLRVPFSGRWIVDIDYDGSTVPSGPAVVMIGALPLVGTFSSVYTGAFVGQVRARVIAGAGGWGKVVSAKSYHDDGGVRRAEVLAAIAREAGETIDTSGDATRMAIDFTRLSERASTALEGALGGGPWRVDYDGVTRYGARGAVVLGAAVELLAVEPRARVMTFGAPDPSGVPIGAVVSDARLGAPLVVHEIEASIQGSGVRVMAWGIPA